MIIGNVISPLKVRNYGAEFSYTKSLLVATDEYINWGTNANIQFDGTDAFSLGTWVKIGAGSIGNLEYIMTNFSNDANLRGWAIAKNPNETVRFFVRNTGGARLDVATDVTDVLSQDTWCRVLITYDGSEAAPGVNIYFDGLVQAQGAVTDTLSGQSCVSTQATTIGIRTNGSNNPFTGNLLAPTIYNYELTPAQAALDAVVNQDLMNTPGLTDPIQHLTLNDSRDNFNSDVVNGYRFYSAITGGLNGDTVNVEEADLELDVPA